MKTDPGSTNRQSFYPYPQRGSRAMKTRTETGAIHALPGRIGAAEGDLTITTTETDTTITLSGWFTNTLTLNDRQAAFLFRTLSQFITLDD